MPSLFQQLRSRRSFFRHSLTSFIGAAILPAPLFAADPANKRFRIVQITDSHVIDEKSESSTRRMLDRIIKEERPDMIFHTGDVIMDAMKADRPAIESQWQCWQRIIAGVDIPIHYCIGNHDTWWNQPHADDPLYGKKWVVQELQLPGRYYSFAERGWHFIFLDSTQPHGESSYIGGIDEEQLQWLTHELQQVPASTPVLIASHIPLLSASIFDWSTCKEAIWNVSGGLMHTDSHEVQALFRRHRNVKGCISGHLHLQDALSYDGIHYMGCGAVSGNWWSDSVFHQTVAGYAVMDLAGDGTIQREYKEYDWKKA